MHQILFVATGGSVAAVAIASFVVSQHRLERTSVVARVSEPRSYVELLTTPAAVADAARRAASLERDVAAHANFRAEHYESLVVTDADQRLEATLHDIGQRNAS
jgi:hypothetical protein